MEGCKPPCPALISSVVLFYFSGLEINMAFLLSSSPRTDQKKTKSKMAELVIPIRPMNGGNGLYSYSKNSTFQRKAIEATKELINKTIAEELDVNAFSPPNTFRISDLGCSVGTNTLLAVENIINAVQHKFQSQGNGTKLPEFQVFFNDQASNDFNQLFTSLPSEMQYFAAGVPGSFCRRLFPKNSLHFVHSSSAAHWLSRVPEEVEDKSSPAWNKGKVHYSNSTPEVIKAFEAQFAKDMDNFLKIRAQEIVHGGLMVLILPGRLNGAPHDNDYINKVYELLKSSLIDMAKKGMISDEKVDSFNVPVYFASLQEVEAAVKRNGCFNIELMENIFPEKPQPKAMSATFRAGLEGTFKEHFGDEILDELFDKLLYNKLEESSSNSKSCELVYLFVSLKRNANA